MKHKVTCLAVPAALATLLAGQASASVLVEAATDFTAGATVLVTWDTAQAVGAKSNRDLIQTFEVASATDLAALELTISSAGDGISTTLRLFDTGADLAGNETSVDTAGWSELINESVTFDSADATASSSAARLIWTLASSQSLVTGQTYALMVDDSGSSTNAFQWRYDNIASDAYADGRAYLSGSGTTWDQINGAPGGQQIDLGLAIVPIPEPGSLALLGLGSLLILGRRKSNAG